MKKIFLILLSVYALTTMLMAQTTTFTYTGAMQTYTVGICVDSITVDVKGAEGATVVPPAGKGGRVQAAIAVTGGTVLYIYVGGAGTGPFTGGYNGGGTGAVVSTYTCGRGGGASDIRQGGMVLADRIVVAAGGGGGGGNAGWPNNGGDGGGMVGNPGIGAWGDPGGGATQATGGVGGCFTTNCGQNGVLGIGGNGANVNNGGAGGGGGYYGGGGAGDAWGGGGGGSSYITSASTNVTHTMGFQTGNGEVIITVASASGPTPPSPGPVTGPSTVCAGATAAYSIGSVSGATSYSWNVPAGATIISGPGTTSVTVTFGTASGNISVAAANSCGNGTPSVKAVTVDSCATGIPARPAGGSSADRNTTIIINPNPTTGKFKVEIAELKVESRLLSGLEVYNIMGEKVFTSPLTPLSHGRGDGGEVIDISSHPPGIYFVKIVFENENVIGKIIKQ